MTEELQERKANADGLRQLHSEAHGSHHAASARSAELAQREVALAAKEAQQTARRAAEEEEVEAAGRARSALARRYR